MSYPFYELMINVCDISWGWNGFNLDRMEKSPKRANRHHIKVMKKIKNKIEKFEIQKPQNIYTAPPSEWKAFATHHLHLLRHHFLYSFIYLYSYEFFFSSFPFQDDLTGQAILDVVFARLNLIETAYFGLRFLDEENQTVSDSLLS